ncbi:MAG TPA: hypothetical protein VGM37_12590 [Armatimonadota bacterium]|jgi:hypothetical protein
MALVERRPFGADETRRVEASMARYRRNGRRFVAAAIAAPASCVVGLALAPDDSRFATVLFVLLIAWGLLLPAWLLLIRDSFRAARGLGRDLAAGEVLCFAGIVPECLMGDVGVLPLVKKRLLRRDAEPQTLEILAASHAVWLANGQTPSAWVTVPVTGVAETPAYAAIAAEWVKPLTPAEDETLFANARDMTADECAELMNHARSNLRLAGLLALLVNYGLTARGISLYASGSHAVGIGCVLLAAALHVYVFRVLRTGLRLRRDARQGRLAIFRASVEPEEEGGDALSPPVEILPASRIIWTEDGVPSAWRKITLGR